MSENHKGDFLTHTVACRILLLLPHLFNFVMG